MAYESALHKERLPNEITPNIPPQYPVRWYQRIYYFFNRYLLFFIATFLGVYLYLYPDVLQQVWHNLTAYSGASSDKFNLNSLFQALLFFMCASYILRHFKTFLEKSLLPRFSIDIGTTHTIVALVGYVLWFFIVLSSLSIIGIDLKNLALVFGALSVGIGFGLQNIVNNFVSGIVILFERPIKEGDWVVINGQEGIVKTIRIRSTELETFDRASVLIPNADILSGNVLNWTHENMFGRVVVKVSVAFGSDIHQARDILLALAQKDKRLLRNPEPYVWVTTFGDNGTTMELRAITENVLNKGAIQSDLMFEAMKAFEKEGIQWAIPQRTIHVKEGKIAK